MAGPSASRTTAMTAPSAEPRVAPSPLLPSPGASGSVSRVWSAIGTYVGLRGGDRYPTLIRRYEPLPLRFFLEDGSATTTFTRAIGGWQPDHGARARFRRLRGESFLGRGSHGSTLPTSEAYQIFPEAMRYLWKDCPSRCKPAKAKMPFWPHCWCPARSGGKSRRNFAALTMAANAKGSLF